MYKKILVPVDGSGKSLLAARQASGLASILGSAVTLFHVAPPLPVERYCSNILGEMQHQNEMLE